MSDKLGRIKRELDAVVGDDDVQVLKDISDKLDAVKEHNKLLDRVYKELKRHGQDNVDLKEFLAYISELVEKVNTKKIPGKFDVEVKNQKEFPKEVMVNNLEDIKIPEPKEVKIPDKVKIKEAGWLSKYIQPVIDSIGAGVEHIKQSIQKVNIVNNDTPEKSIAVRLVDKKGKKFVDPSPTTYVTAGGGGGAPVGKTPIIENVTLTSADTEYSVSLPENIKALTIQSRSDVDLRVAFDSGKVAGAVDPYLTIKGGQIYYEQRINAGNANTLYVASTADNDTAEIIYWS